MFEQSRGVCFVEEHFAVAGAGFLVLERVRQGDLDGHLPIGERVVSAEHDPHAATPDLLVNFVLSDFVGNQRAHGGTVNEFSI